VVGAELSFIEQKVFLPATDDENDARDISLCT